MSFPRFVSRSVHRCAVDHMTQALTAYAWLTADSVPFGGDPISIISTSGFAGDRLAEDLGDRTVAITLGNEYDPKAQETGGSLYRQDYPIFYDVFMPTEAEATALSDDIRDVLLGRVEAYRRISLTDQVTGNTLTDWSIEVEDVERIRPDHTFPLAWQTVHATFVAYYPEVVY